VSSDRRDGAESPLLRVDGIGAEAGGSTILHDITLDVGEREVVGLLGPSGCGKTTLLRVVAGLHPPSRGTVVLGGRDLDGIPPHERGVGLMFQHYALFPHRDVAGNIEFGLRMHGVPRPERRRRVDDVLALVGLPSYGERKVATLSGGEQQRVALARAIAPEPRLLMLDEPLGALDRTLRDRLVVDLQELFANLGTTVLYVTHDQAEALAVTDRVAVMDHGRIVQTGTPRELWSRPATPFVARFLGFTNLVEVDARGGWLWAPWGRVAPSPHVAEGRATVVVRPSGIALDEGASGAIASVEGHTFQGDRTLVQLRVAGGTRLDAEVAGQPPPVGADVSLAIDPSAVVVVDSAGCGS
jgi:thiamine transport system ATP-binding protein